MAMKLYYFDLKGYAEGARYMLYYSKLPFEDVRFTRDEWPKKKEELNTPFGKVPVLEEGGRKLNQSIAISRYIGRKTGLVPTDPWQEAILDATILTLYEYIEAAKKLITDDESKKEEMKKESEKLFEYYFSRFEKQVADNHGFFSVKLSWVDFHFVGVLDAMIEHMKLSVDGYPAISGLMKMIHSLPGVKDYIENRKN